MRMTALERQQAPVVQNNSMDSQPEAFEHVLELEPTKPSPVPREMKAMTAQVVDDEAMADEAMADSLLNSSFWDALTVVGLPQVGMTTSCLLAMGAVLSIVIQGAFVQILYESFLAPDAKYDASFLADWRLLAGHAAQGYDTTSKSSLVSRMCNGKPFDREWWHWQRCWVCQGPFGLVGPEILTTLFRMRLRWSSFWKSTNSSLRSLGPIMRSFSSCPSLRPNWGGQDRRTT